MRVPSDTGWPQCPEITAPPCSGDGQHATVGFSPTKIVLVVSGVNIHVHSLVKMPVDGRKELHQCDTVIPRALVVHVAAQSTTRNMVSGRIILHGQWNDRTL
jgi:hypothetical protein